MTVKIQVMGNKEVSIYYKKGVKQSMESAWDGKRVIENIPFDSIKNWSITKEEARGMDANYQPRPHFWHGDKHVIVQNNAGVPIDMWNVEMYNYEKECSESKYRD